MLSVKEALSTSRKAIAGVKVMFHSFLLLAIAERV